MDAQNFRSLQEAYSQVYQVDEGKSSRPRYPGGRGVLDQETRDEKRESHAENRRGHTAGPGTVTKNPKKLRKQKAMGEIGEQVDIYDIIFSHLLDEGYADTQEAAEVIMVNMSEEWREEIMEGMTMKDFKANRQKNKRRAASADAEKRGHVGKEWYNSGRKYSPDEAKRSRAKMDDEERSTRHRSAVDPDDDRDVNYYSADKTKNPKKLRKQKAMGEFGEQVDIYDIILSHLLDEGYAETPEAAEVIMVNMSEDWRESIVEADSLAAFQARREKRRAAMKKKTGYEGHDYSKPPAKAAAEREERMRKFINKD